MGNINSSGSISSRSVSESLSGGRGIILWARTAEEAERAQAQGASAVRLPYYTEEDEYDLLDRVRKIKASRALKIPFIMECRIGHTGEAQVLAARYGPDYIQETRSPCAPVDPAKGPYVDKKQGFNIPFICDCRCLVSALRRVSEGASLLLIKGSTSDLAGLVGAISKLKQDIGRVVSLDDKRRDEFADKYSLPRALVMQIKERGGRLPVPVFAADCGGQIKTPADAVMIMQLGVVDGVSLFSYTLKTSMLKAIKHFDDPKFLSLLPPK